VVPSTVHRWLADGFIAGEQPTPGASWRIRVTDQLRARFVEQAPEGWLPMLEATMTRWGCRARRCCSVSSAASSALSMCGLAGERACVSRSHRPTVGCSTPSPTAGGSVMPLPNRP
jgi:hypothetical protein